MQVKVRFIGHSGFSVQLREHFLLFDYFHGPFPGYEINHSKYPSVFASHSHSDHFNKKIFTLANGNPSTRFFLSDEITDTHQNAFHLGRGETFKEHDIEVYALGSTDIGVSFAVVCEGITIFHAGDLNYWSWKKESTEDEIAQAYKVFMQEIKQIQKQFTDFDIAFFPIDPRLQKDIDEAANIFLDTFNVTHFFPMHFATRLKVAKDFQQSYTGSALVYAPDEAGHTFELDI